MSGVIARPTNGDVEDDQTIWRDTALSQLERVESTLRCPICQDFMRSPCSLKTCGHGFCSECLRRAIQLKGECPTCRTRCSATDLVPNKVVRAVISSFVSERAGLLEIARQMKASFMAQNSQTSVEQKLENDDIKDNARVENNNATKSFLDIGSSSDTVTASKGQAVQKQRLANMNFHILKDRKIKEIAAQYKLSNAGPRAKLVRRIKEYILLFNTLVDGDEPITEADLARIRHKVAAMESILDKKSGPSLVGEGGKKGTLPPVILNDTIKELFRSLRRQVVERDNIKRPKRKGGKKKRKACSSSERPEVENKGAVENSSTVLQGTTKEETPISINVSDGTLQRGQVNRLVASVIDSPKQFAKADSAGVEASDEGSSSSSTSVGDFSAPVPKSQRKRVSAKNESSGAVWRKVASDQIPGFMIHFNTATQEVFLEPCSQNTTMPRALSRADINSSSSNKPHIPSVEVIHEDVVNSHDNFVEVVELQGRPSKRRALKTPAANSSTTGWTCQACTYYNPSDLKLTCEVCEKARNRAPSSKLPVDLLRKKNAL
mmetsp:Transcript_7008/g.14041  ORF Transcript_7008/g.14041 Transcript_7008/m.14041 type:complete len:549 (-) Transcript_7008:160-1806(-)